MEINSNTNLYAQYQLPDDFTKKIKQGETLEAIPYTGTAFDNISPTPPPLTFYTSHSYYGKDTDYINIDEPLTSLMDVEKEDHALQRYQLTDSNIKLYADSMLSHADEHVTKSTVSVAGLVVGLETTWDEFAGSSYDNLEIKLSEIVYELYQKADDNSPEKAKLEQFIYPSGEIKAPIAGPFLDASRGDFSTYVEKLEELFGDLVSVEEFSEGEGPTYAESHLMLNDSTFEDFVTNQTNKLYKSKEHYENFDDMLAKQIVLGNAKSL